MLPDVFDFDDVIEEVEEDEELEVFNGYSYLYDFEKGDFIYENGEPVKVYGEKAVEIWIEKALRTRLNIYTLYRNDDRGTGDYAQKREYGSNVWTLVRGKKMPQLYLRAEIIRDIEEMVGLNSAIKRVDNFYIGTGQGGEPSYKLRIEFDVILYTEEDFRMEVEM